MEKSGQMVMNDTPSVSNLLPESSTTMSLIDGLILSMGIVRVITNETWLVKIFFNPLFKSYLAAEHIPEHIQSHSKQEKWSIFVPPA